MNSESEKNPVTPIDDWTGIAHALGDLPPGQAAAVELAAAADADLAAKLSFLTAMSDLPPAPPPATLATPVVAGPKRIARRRWLKALAASVAGVALLGGAAYAGYALLREKPLVEDDFSDEWLDTRTWETSRGRKGVREEGGKLRLLNRGSVVTAREFDQPIEVELDWEWLDLAGDPQYTDVLTVGLRTSGRHEPQHSYQLTDGVRVEFNSHSGAVSVYAPDDPKAGHHSSEPGGIKFSAGKRYHLRITDDGTRIAVYVSGPQIDRESAKRPVVVAEVDVPAGEHRVAIYNREYVGGANHESRIDNVLVRKLRAD